MGYGYGAPAYGAPATAGYAGCAPTAGYGAGGGFALIVVLFILLIIVGATIY